MFLMKLLASFVLLVPLSTWTGQVFIRQSQQYLLRKLLVKTAGNAGKGAAALTVGADEHPVHLNRAWPARLLNVSAGHDPSLSKNVAALTVRIVAAEAHLARLEGRRVDFVVRLDALGVLNDLGVLVDELVQQPLRPAVRAGIVQHVHAHRLLHVEAKELQIVGVGVRVVVGRADAAANKKTTL